MVDRPVLRLRRLLARFQRGGPRGATGRRLGHMGGHGAQPVGCFRCCAQVGSSSAVSSA